MEPKAITFTVFTKPWHLPLTELGQFVKGLGFDGVELPVRPGYQVEPEHAARDLPQAARQLADCGLTIPSIAGATDFPDERMLAACAEANVRIYRSCLAIGEEPYLTAEARLQRSFDALLPLLERYGVTLGIQNHCGNCVCNAMGLRHLLEKYPPQRIAAVWDAAHNALNGEVAPLALDIVWSHLCLVNLKNAIWQRTSGPEATEARWSIYWTTGRQGLASWSTVAQELRHRQYRGAVCLTAEYSDGQAVDRLIAEDLAYAKSLFA